MPAAGRQLAGHLLAVKLIPDRLAVVRATERLAGVKVKPVRDGTTV